LSFVSNLHISKTSIWIKPARKLNRPSAEQITNLTGLKISLLIVDNLEYLFYLLLDLNDIDFTTQITYISYNSKWILAQPFALTNWYF